MNESVDKCPKPSLTSKPINCLKIAWDHIVNNIDLPFQNHRRGLKVPSVTKLPLQTVTDDNILTAYEG